MHLMTALCVWLSWPIAQRSWKTASASLNAASPPPSQRADSASQNPLHQVLKSPALAKNLQKLHAVQNLANPAFEDALLKESVARARRFIAGIKAYQNHHDHRDVPEAPVIWQSGTTKLRDYGAANPDAPLMLVIPSLINRYTILDLDIAPSYLRTLAREGFRPVVVDWDVPGEDEREFTLSDYVVRRLVPIVEFLLQWSVVGGQWSERKATDHRSPSTVHLVGYCMGGLLALALASLMQDRIKTLSLLATPWDFHKPDANNGPIFRDFAQQVEPCLASTGFLPVDVIQSLFAAFQPLNALQKFTGFTRMHPDSMEARHFVLLEDWLNDGVPLTAPVARECLHDWYGENRTAKNEWHIDGKIIDPKNITVPCYVIVPGRDRIVPPESALALAKALPHVTLHEPMMGHIGMIASSRAPRQVWAAQLHWLKEHV